MDREEARRERHRGEPTLLAGTFAWPAGTPPRGRYPFPGVLREGGGAGFVSFLKTRARAAGLSFPGGARSGESWQLSALCRVPSSRSPFSASGWHPVNRRGSFSAFSDIWDGERESIGQRRSFVLESFQETVFVYSCVLKRNAFNETLVQLAAVI